MTAMDPHAFLKALLMGRIIPLHYHSVELRQRISDIQLLLETFQKVPAPQTQQALEVDLTAIHDALKIIQLEKDFTQAQKKYDEALSTLMTGIELDRGDQKKWPHLNSEEKALRILTNYFASSPNRFVLERPFRTYHVAYHLCKAEKDLAQNQLMETEQDLLNAQEELRHVIALSLGVDLREFREEVETFSQVQDRPEREVCLEQFEKFLQNNSPAYEKIRLAIEPLLKNSKISSQFIQLLHEKKFAPKTLQNLKNHEDILQALHEQTENLSITLDAQAKIDWSLLLKKLLNLPDPLAHCYYRMPDVNRLRKIQIKNQEGQILLEFDEQGRLVQAPSVEWIQSGKDSKPDCLDVAIIGGGPGGISAAVNLMGFGVFRLAVFERAKPNSTVIDIWSREKEADTYYSGPPGKIVGLVGMQDTTRAVFLSRMNSFIDYYHLNFKNKERVIHLEKTQNGFWKISTQVTSYQARIVIMTAGRYGKPKLLKWEEGNIPEALRKSIIRGVEVDDIENASVLVIGGGNTAFDNVKTLCANGKGSKKNKIYLSYYKKPFNVPGSLHVHNNDQLLQWEAEGLVTILWGTNTEKVEEVIENGKKRWKVSFREGEQPASLVVDYFAPAVGWQIDKDMMEKVGVAFDKGNPLCDPETGQAFKLDVSGNRQNIESLYLTGDYAIQKSVPTALITNFHAAKAILEKFKKN